MKTAGKVVGILGLVLGVIALACGFYGEYKTAYTLAITGLIFSTIDSQ